MRTATAGTALREPRPILGVEGAERGALPPLEAWEGFAGAAHGAGATLRATPLSLASAYAAIANGGVRVEPSLDGRGGEERVLSAASARRIREMLVHVVEDEGATGRLAKLEELHEASSRRAPARAPPRCRCSAGSRGPCS